MSGSDVARMRKQIELAMESAAIALNGLRQTANHAIIHHQYEVLNAHHKDLESIIGEEAAITVLQAICERVIE